ncbi:MAG: hypothetical protein ACOCYO_03950 [Bacteroidota bacterium]
MKKQEIIAYLKKVIRIRRRLISKSKSRNNTLQALADLEHVSINLEANENSFSPIGLAKFVVRNERRIMNIIPGKDSRNHKALIKEYHRIRFHCDMILNGRDEAVPCLNENQGKTL